MNILLVDDDRFVIAALEKNMDWESLGITNVFTAYDIKRAQEILANNTVDLLLSDIDMPQGSGLDLLGILREQGNSIPAIFLTNYADFSYAKRALELRSFHYFLKPIDYDEMAKIIKQALLEVTSDGRDMATSMSKLWYDYLIDRRITYKALMSDMNRHQVFEKGIPSYITCLIQFGDGKLDDDRGMMAARIRHITESIFGSAFTSQGVLIPYQSEDFILFALIPVDGDEAVGARLRPLFGELYYSLSDEFGVNLRLFLSSEKKVSEIPDVLDSMLNMRTMPFDEESSIIYIDETSVTTLLQYVDAHFTEDMSREHLSELFYFAPDYITKIFRKETGMSFKNYIIEKRLDLARKLLQTTDYSVRDISLKVGYDNYSYFTRLFKKSFGVTPVEFRGK
ncbi:response regulator transcription factor [Butyrivibrio sp. AE3006]|uniref:response regulator transcription factor n=1 Tax=Butyrivibrio sp. AE3006 TaxID=1280673 RepID=UPI0004006366|nr:response regulator [Butyrivibrio sp. AE3006]